MDNATAAPHSDRLAWMAADAADRRWIMPVTKDQAEMIATLAAAARPHGARRWDAPGVMAAIAKVKHLDLAEVMIAAGRAARDRDLETPGAIGNPAAVCWVERPVTRFEPEKTTAESRCGVCGRARGVCESAPRFADDDHMFTPDFKDKRDGDSVRQIVDAVKAEVATTVEPTERKKLDALLPEERNSHVAELRAQTNPTAREQIKPAETEPDPRSAA